MLRPGLRPIRTSGGKPFAPWSASSTRIMSTGSSYHRDEGEVTPTGRIRRELLFLFLGGRRTGRLAALLDACRLTRQIAQVVEACAADLAVRLHFDLVDRRGVERKDPLDADAVRDLADGDRRAQAALLPTDHDPFEDLDALFLALLDLRVDSDSVTDLDVRDVLLQIGRFDLVDHAVHRYRSGGVVLVVGGPAVKEKRQSPSPRSRSNAIAACASMGRSTASEATRKGGSLRAG